MRGVSLPLSFARSGDVVDEDGRGGWVVISHVWQEKGGTLRILYLNTAGQLHDWRCVAGTTPTLVRPSGAGLPAIGVKIRRIYTFQTPEMPVQTGQNRQETDLF